MILTGHQLLKIIKMIELFNDHGKNGQIFNGVLNIFLNKQLWWLSRSTFFALSSSASCLHSDVESVRGLKRLLSVLESLKPGKKISNKIARDLSWIDSQEFPGRPGPADDPPNESL